MNWYVYLLRCSDKTLYCGITSNLERRLKTHNSGKGARYTRGRLPVTLVYIEPVLSVSEALRKEYQIKRLSRIKKLELVKSFTNY